MAVNLRARRTIVTVGGINVTPILVSVEIASNGFDGLSGLEKAAGTLTLALNAPDWNYQTQPLDARLNPDLWAKGVAVTIETETMTGQLVRHPRGALKILRIPGVPNIGAETIAISIGCDLTLSDWKQPAGEATGMNLDDESGLAALIANGYPRSDAITAIAQSVGLPPLQDAIAVFPLTAPIAQMGGGYVQQMGQIAAAAARVLWMNGAGQLRASAVSLGESSIAVLNQRDHAAVFDRAESNENPIDKFITTATVKKVQALPNTGPGTIIAISTTRDYDPSEISTTRFRGFGSKSVTTEQTIERARKLVMPETKLPAGTLITALISTKKTTYGGAYDFKTQESEKTQEPLGKLRSDLYPNSTELGFSREVVTRHFFDGLVTRKIRTETYEPRYLIVPTSQSSDPELSQWEETRWFPVGNQWGKRISRANLKTGETFEETTFSSSQNQPPAPDRYQPPYQTVEERLEGVATFPAVGAGYPKSQPVEVPTASSKEQLDGMALLLGQLARARQYPVTFAVDLRPEFLENWRPLQVVEWVEVTGERGRYLILSSAWTMTPTESVVACEAVQLTRSIEMPRPGGGLPIVVEAPLWREATVMREDLVIVDASSDRVLLPVTVTVMAETLAIVGALPPFGYVTLAIVDRSII